MADLLADSYAFFEHVGGNPRYQRVFHERDVVTTAMNVLEVYHVLRRQLAPEVALKHAQACLSYVTDVPREVALAAAEFKEDMVTRKRNCSYIDAWGYEAARALGRKFLTGDRAFEGIAHVEFLK
ncbi:MAG: PIN domain-containing protein [Euryarchaeota archaeon]|nr:PIN domain-containing protein [Euryarchaeota archaeon]MDE1837190.1 PIN domain-containing protein [Euryarchaeota archaeon]MDE1881684.1 PIN domain-containing protein [Euryarchaeota archaeon]MDE2045346.1 PIN domain-containing protein [Thermoplasmata archaeon]